jgi:dienelactone hydrolase
MRLWRGWGGAACLMLCGFAMAQTTAQVPSLDAPRGQVVQLPGMWFQAAGLGAGAAPAMVLLHGCGGMYGRRDALSERMQVYVARLNAMGIHALVLDSLTPRGERELCTQKNGQRRVTQLHRRRDALGALAWLAQRPDVDAQRLGLMGWSNGGSTVLAASDATHPEVAGAVAKPSLAVAYYPGCESALRGDYRPVAPLLMLVGEDDDWTPAAPCKALAERLGSATELTAYPGAGHGFDGSAPVRHRPEVPNGVRTGAGVHVGGHPAARAAAFEHLDTYLRRQWRLNP